MDIVAFITGWIFLFLTKNFIYKLILAALHTIIQKFESIEQPLEKTILPLENLNFSKVIINIILVAFCVIMIAVEYGQLNTNMVGVFGEEKLDAFQNIYLSNAASLTYIIITIILGVFAFELLGFRSVIRGFLLNSSSEESSWREFGRKAVEPQNVFKIFIGLLSLMALLYLANIQGILSIEREKIANEVSNNINSTTEIQSKLLYALGFFVPVLAAITFISLEIFIAAICRIAILALVILEKVFADLYAIFKAVLDFITSPVQWLFEKLVQAFGEKTGNYLKPMEEKPESAKINEALIFKKYFKGGVAQHYVDKKTTSSLEQVLKDDIEESMDDLF